MTFCLFLFFMMIVYFILSQLKNIPEAIDNVILSHIADATVFVVVTFLGIYSLISIYKTLQRKVYSIFALKVSIIFIALYWALYSLSFIGNGQLMMTLIFSFPLLFLIIFFIYLLRSKKVNSYIPKQKRKVGVFGLTGLILGGLLLISLTCPFVTSAIYAKRSFKNMQEISRNGNKYTDGIATFQIPKQWIYKNSKHKGNGKTVYLFTDRMGSTIYAISQAQGSCKSRLEFLNTVGYYSKEIKGLPTDLEEITYGNEIINDNTFNYEAYKCKDSSGRQMYWTITALADDNSYRAYFVSYYGHVPYKEILVKIKQMMSTVVFD